MKFTFETDDENEAQKLFHAADAFAALDDIYNTARNQLKHCPPNESDACLQRIKTLANEAMGLVQ